MNGHCMVCGQPYEAPNVQDGICPSCKALEPKNDPGPVYDDGPPWPWSRAAMRERLGISGDRDE